LHFSTRKDFAEVSKNLARSENNSVQWK